MAVPVWAAKLGTAAVKGLLGDEGSKKLFKAIMFIVLGIIAIFFALIVSIPTVLLHFPLIGDNYLAKFYKVISNYNPDGIKISWEEVTAVYGALHNQDYSGVSSGDIKDFAKNWLEEHTEDIKDQYGNVIGTRHWYTLRSMDEVMDILNLNSEQKELAKRLLEGLKEGGMKPPSGWRAEPSVGWSWPLPGYDSWNDISSPYGFRIDPIKQEPSLHYGVDIAAPEGTGVIAARAGTVKEIGNDNVYGLYVVIEGGFYTIKYAHLSKISVSEGTQVEAGDVIGRSGNTGRSTGPHLHFEIKCAGRHMNPLNFY